MAPAAVKIISGRMKSVESLTTAAVRRKRTARAAKACDLFRIEIYTWNATIRSSRKTDNVLFEISGSAEKK